MSSWISVNQRLPEPYKPVIISVKEPDGYHVIVGWYYDGDWKDLFQCKYIKSPVTHWQPFPESPSDIRINFFDKEQIYTDCTVQVLTNTVTGEQSIGWWHNAKMEASG